MNAVLRDIANINLGGPAPIPQPQQNIPDDDDEDDDEDESESEDESDGEDEVSSDDEPEYRFVPIADTAAKSKEEHRAPAEKTSAASVPPFATLSDGSTTDSGPRTPIDEGRGSSEPSLRKKAPSVASGNQVNVENPSVPSQKEPSAPVPPSKVAPPEVIIISSGDENDSSKRQVGRTQKAAAMKRLTSSVSKAVDNVELGRLVGEFIQVLRSNSSKFMTKEGFAFLDSLESQLVDPDVFVVDSKQQKAPATRSADPLQGMRKQASHAETIKFLRQRMTSNQSLGNSQVGALLGAFTKALRKGAARTVTTDGFAFLVGLEASLQRT